MDATTHPQFRMRQHVRHPEWGTLCVRSIENSDGLIVIDYSPIKADEYHAQVLKRFLLSGVYYPGAVDHLYVEMVDVKGNVNFYKAYPLFRGIVVAAEEAQPLDIQLSEVEISTVKFRIKDFLGLWSSQLRHAC